MAKYKIAWLPGDGIGIDVLEATRIVRDQLALDAHYLPGDIGWDFWCAEGDAFPARTVELLKNVDAAMFGAITSKPETGWGSLASAEPGNGYVLRFKHARSFSADLPVTYVRFYVVEWLTNTSGGIMGARVKYQHPF